MKINMVICFLIGLVLGWLFASSIAYVPKDSLVMGRLMRIQRAVQRYYAAHQICPASLPDLKEDFELRDEFLKADSSKKRTVYYSVVDGTNVILRINMGDACQPNVRQTFVLEFNVCQ